VSAYELKEILDECVEIIQRELKMRTVVFMDEYKYFFEEDPKFDWNGSPDKYYFQIKIHGKLAAERMWDATWYPAKIRYDVNIKKHISRIIYLISSVLSSQDNTLTTKYGNYSLIKTDYDSAYSIEETK
jgi:hypothetical protein